jgi:PmbA protein
MFLPKERCLEVIRSMDAGEAEAYTSTAHSLSVEYAGNTYKSKEFSSDSGYGIRIIENGRMGFSHSNTQGGAQAALTRARKLARFSPKTGFSLEPAHGKYPSPETSDSRLDELSPDSAFSAVREILEGIKSRGATPTRISVALSRGKEQMANSSSLFAESDYTSVSAYAEAKKGSGMGYSLYSSCFLPEGESFSRFGEEAGRIAFSMDKSRPIKSRKIMVNFSPHALSSLIEFLLFHFEGDNKRRGISRLQKGAKSFSESLSLSVDPLAQADSACPFDGDGAPSAPKELISRGVVRGFLYDRYTAALEGIEEGGCCQRSDYSSIPSPGITNLIIRGGTGDSEPPEEYLEVFSFHGLHTSDPVSGHFGVDVDIAFLHKGEEASPVSNVLLSGNIFNLFNKIEYIGKEQRTQGSLVSPDVWFSDVQLIGK